MSAIKVFLAMGGYAQFVWPAYGAAFLVLGGLVIQSRRRHRASRKAIEDLQRQEATE